MQSNETCPVMYQISWFRSALLQECTRFTSDLHQVHIINAPGKKTGFWEETSRREEQEEWLHAKDVVFLIYIIK
jgi:hypothetical protein